MAKIQWHEWNTGVTKHYPYNMRDQIKKLTAGKDGTTCYVHYKDGRPKDSWFLNHTNMTWEKKT